MNSNNRDSRNVLVIGSIAIDDIQTPFGRRRKSLGGSAIYFSWACSFFSSVSMVGVVGEDFPQKYIDMLNQRQIDTKAIKQIKGKTFHWEGRYDYDFNTAHTINTELNVFADFKPELLSFQKNIPYLFLANIDPDIQLEVARSMERPRIVAADTMNFWIDSKRDELLKVLKIVDILVINDAEARQLGDDPNVVCACRKIIGWGPRVVIAKQGEYGAIMFYTSGKNKKIQTFATPSIPLETVRDPTGAGDSFAGAFMGYIASQGTIDERILRTAVAMGTVVASFTVEGFSIDGLKKIELKDIFERYRQLRDIAYFDILENI